MAIIDFTKELAEILTSAFGNGWGWAALLLLRRGLVPPEKKTWKLVLLHYTGRERAFRKPADGELSGLVT
jgi:hypothetical protein